MFLNAKDVDAFRGSCQFLHSAMETIVPGLKLKLYSHQLSSLSWMRRRESRALCETDLLLLDPRQGHDLHGPATGGRTALLRPRPPTVKLPSASGATLQSVNEHWRPVRICTTFGSERNWLEEAETDPRCVVRGGLLWYVTVQSIFRSIGRYSALIAL